AIFLATFHGVFEHSLFEQSMSRSIQTDILKTSPFSHYFCCFITNNLITRRCERSMAISRDISFF
ncbi:MAG: hypothetical protein KAJ23_14995, partial [Maribacter sp.]|nr:hypothetical protein [Maribacter sp.]